MVFTEFWLLTFYRIPTLGLGLESVGLGLEPWPRPSTWSWAPLPWTWSWPRVKWPWSWTPGSEALVLFSRVLSLTLVLASQFCPWLKHWYVAVHRIWADVLLYTASVTVARITMLVIGTTVYLWYTGPWNASMNCKYWKETFIGKVALLIYFFDYLWL